MPKRIALFIIGFVIAIGAFLLYQYITGASILSGRPHPTAIVATTRSAPLTFEYRTTTGELRYVLTAKQMEQITDPVTKADLPGQFKLKEPVATFFSHDGRAISIRGDTCQIAVDQLRHINDSTGEKDIPQIRDGKLSGNIVLTIGGKPAAPGTPDSGKDDTIVRFESDVLLNGADQLLTSPGKVQVRSNVVVFDGEGFTLNYSIDKARQENQRVEFLRIDKGNKIILKNKGAKAFSLDGESKGPATTPAANTPATTTAPIDPANLPTAYKLSFGTNVKATYSTDTLTSDELYVLFTAPSNKEMVKAANKTPDEETPKPRTAAATQAASATTRTATSIPTIEPMGEAGPEDLVITWVGPMEMRPVENADVQLLDSNDVVLEAVGHGNNPVKISEPKRWVSAGKLWYHKAEQRLELAPGEDGKVQFGDTGNTNETTTVMCQGVSVFLDEKGQTPKHVRLMGPGTLQMPASAAARKEASKEPLVAKWERVLDVDMETVPDAKDPKKTIQVPRHVVMNGASIKDADFDLTADMLDLAIANTGSSSSAALEHMLATGNVNARSLKKGTSGIEAQRLEVQTSIVAGSKSPVPTKVIADGEVKAWQITEKKPTTPVAAAAAPANDYRKQTVYGPHLEADLEPAPKTATAAAAQNADATTADFGAMGGGKVKHFLVNGGIHITLENGKTDPVEIAAESLESVLPLATLTGKDKDTPVHIIRGKDEVFGDVVQLDNDKKSFAIPGPGKFLLELKDKKSKEPTPMEVTWSKEMHFDQKSLLATFTGDIAAVTKGKTKEPGSLKCNRMLTVKLLNTAGKTTGDTDLETAGAGGLDYITAEGNVDTEAIQYDADNNLLTRMDLNTQLLTYTGATHLLEVPVPGAMFLSDRRPEKAKAANAAVDPESQSPRGDSLFGWDGKFSFDTDKNIITFEKKVVMKYTPLKPFHVAEEKDATGVIKPPAPVHLETELLTATLIHSKDKTGENSVSPVGLGAGGNFKLGSVSAGGVANEGAATIQMDDFLLSGYTIGFDAEKHIVTAVGNSSMSATVMRNNRGMVEAKSIMWDLSKNANRFEFIEPIGTFEAISDLQN